MIRALTEILNNRNLWFFTRT